MAYQKQPELNGAFYGPSIPPPPRSYNRRGHRGGRGCCGCCLLDCLCDCGCCLLSCVFKIIFSILIFIGIIILIIWLILRPHGVKFYATSATLSAFNLSTTAAAAAATTVNYNLAVNFTVRNPNRRIGVYYDQIEANFIYSGQRLSTIEAGSFYQGHKNTTSFGPVKFNGQDQAIMIGSDGKDDYEKQTNNGVYEIKVKMYLRVRFKVGLFKFGTYKPKISCDLKVPLEGKSGEKFEETRCGYDL